MLSLKICVLVICLRCLSFLPDMLHTSLKKQFKYSLFMRPSKISLNRVCYTTLYPQCTKLCQNLYISKSFTRLCIHKQPEPHIFVFPDTSTVSDTKMFNKSLIIKLPEQCPNYTDTMSYLRSSDLHKIYLQRQIDIVLKTVSSICNWPL